MSADGLQEKDPRALEERAHAFFRENKLEEAHKLFKEAAYLYKGAGNHGQASLCFASGASCWGIKSGEKTCYEAAALYEEAAKEAMKVHDHEYASILYKHAAVNYERDMEFLSFSNCFYNSKESYRKALFYSLIGTKKMHHIEPDEKGGVKNVLGRFFSWLALTVSCFVWGYGERPVRTFLATIFIIFGAAILYSQGQLLRGGVLFRPDWFHALYFSVITATTVGYGDIAPAGACKVVAMCEAFSGLIVMQLFLVGLARKYLRV